MTVSPPAAAVLALLTDALDDPDVDLHRSLSAFAGEVKLAVPSFLGVSVTMVVRTSRVQIDLMAEDFTGPDGVGSSLRIPATALVGAGSLLTAENPDIGLILYAGHPGAWSDLAADLGWLTGLDRSRFVLDQHRTASRPVDDLTDLDSVFHQALGVLLGREETPEQAEATIERRALSDGVTRPVAAAAILTELLGPCRRPGPAGPDSPGVGRGAGVF